MDNSNQMSKNLEIQYKILFHINNPKINKSKEILIDSIVMQI